MKILLLSGIIALGSAAAASAAFGGFTSSDVVGTWNCTYVLDATVQGRSYHRTLPITVNMNANGTAVAHYSNGEGGQGTTDFTWSYKPTGPAAGTITDPPGTGTMTWHSHNSVHVQRVTQGTGLLQANYVDCTRS